MAKSLYDLLEVSPHASPEVIKNAYRALAAKLHPDKGVVADQQQFDKVTKAYNILIDPEKRTEYDQRRHLGEENILLEETDVPENKSLQTVKRLDGSDTWCTIEEHIRRKGAELANTDLRGLKLRDINLSGANLSGCNLEHSEFTNVDLSKANLQNVTCSQATFSNAKFDGSDFTGARFETCCFRGVSIMSTLIKNASFKSCSFEKTKMLNSSLNGVNFQSSRLNDTVISTVTLKTKTYDPNLLIESECTAISGCDFSNADLSGVVIGGNNLFIDSGVEFITWECYVKDCLFTNANLQNSYFNYSQITGCDFTNANLHAASFKGSSINGIDFTTCRLINARFHQAKCYQCAFPEGFSSGEIRVDNKNELKPETPDSEAYPKTVYVVLVIIVLFIVMLILSN